MSNEEWDDELIKDFFAEFNEAHNIVVETLMKMENSPEDKKLVKTFFRSINSINSLLRKIGMHDISSLVHHLENILDLVRHDEMFYDSMLSDLILALMDVVERCCERAFSGQELDIDIKMVSKLIQEIIDTPNHDKTETINATLAQISVNKSYTPIEESLRDNHLLTGSSDEFDIKAFEAGLPTLADFTPRQRDLSFFRKLNRTLETKSVYEEGRGDRILIIAKAINEALGMKVDEEQLAAAV
jgi:chemotaxis protein histidine kinase CheA